MTHRYTEGLCHLREGSLFFPIECTLLLLRENEFKRKLCFKALTKVHNIKSYRETFNLNTVPLREKIVLLF